jgi:hypothetical protein
MPGSSSSLDKTACWEAERTPANLRLEIAAGEFAGFCVLWLAFTPWKGAYHAFASIKDRAIESRILELNVTSKRIAKVELDDKVIKSGRTTGVTRGIVDRVGVVVGTDGDSHPILLLCKSNTLQRAAVVLRLTVPVRNWNTFTTG